MFLFRDDVKEIAFTHFGDTFSIFYRTSQPKN